MRVRLDTSLVKRGLVPTRSQAEHLVRLGKVLVDGVVARKPGLFVPDTASITITSTERYVSRAGLKLASVAEKLHVDFSEKIMLDVGSSTGGFTDYALQHGAGKVIAVDVGTDQLHPSLHGHSQIELHEKTDIREFHPTEPVDIVVLDVSFISLRDILPHIATVASPSTDIIAMVKPQFEAGKGLAHKGVIKNDSMRRTILKDFEQWSKQYFTIVDKADSEVSGVKGNLERFYRLKALSVIDK